VFRPPRARVDAVSHRIHRLQIVIARERRSHRRARAADDRARRDERCESRASPSGAIARARHRRVVECANDGRYVETLRLRARRTPRRGRANARDVATTRSPVRRARDAVVDAIVSLSHGTGRQTALQWLSLALIVASALMVWKSLMLFTQSESPVVVVLSGSMEPGLRRGDLLLLDNSRGPSEIGDVVVFNIRGRDVPIVHRILHVHANSPADVGSRLMLTKGDNNFADDGALYAPGQRWLRQDDVVGRAVVFLPHVGRLTILMNDYPWFKYGLISILGFFVVTGKD
jgi:signal peptidase